MYNRKNLDVKEHCFCCVNNVKEIDYKDLQLMQKFTSTHHKILPRKKSNLCAKHQRKIALAIKRARFLGLLPYIPE